MKDQVAAAARGHVRYRREIPAESGYSFAYSTHVKELCPQRLILIVGTPPERGAGKWRDLAHPPHLRAEVMGFEIDGNSVRLEHRFQGIGDLLPDALLHRKALGKQAHESSELG